MPGPKTSEFFLHSKLALSTGKRLKLQNYADQQEDLQSMRDHLANSFILEYMLLACVDCPY